MNPIPPPVNAVPLSQLEAVLSVNHHSNNNPINYGPVRTTGAIPLPANNPIPISEMKPPGFPSRTMTSEQLMYIQKMQRSHLQMQQLMRMQAMQPPPHMAPTTGSIPQPNVQPPVNESTQPVPVTIPSQNTLPHSLLSITPQNAGTPQVANGNTSLKHKGLPVQKI